MMRSEQPSVYATPGRKDLQGLRALAVLAVVIYHAYPSVLSGGFVGVDVFFVLSGFLIYRKLLREIDTTGRINLLKFVGGRGRRLVPNASLVIAVTLVASAVLLPKYRLLDIAADARSAALFYSNFHFAGQAVDYFRMNAPPSPFLHFWSLSIEEQFYLLVPLLMAAFAIQLGGRSIRNATAVLAVASALSFAFMLMAMQDSQPAAFFQTQNRIWQLGIGCIVGWGFEFRTKLNPAVRTILAMVAMVAIGSAAFVYSDDLAYPGMRALVPTIGAAVLLIGLDAKPANALSRLLSTPLMTWIGDRSYSIYLWHWPILVIGQSAIGVPGSLALTMIASALAYRFVEEPIHRRRQWNFGGAWKNAVAPFSLSCLVAAFSLVVLILPRPEHIPGRDDAILAASNDFGQNYDDGCHLALEITNPPPCEYGDLDGKRQVVLFGDSHAAQWFEPIDAAAREAGWRFRTMTKRSCPSADVVIWSVPDKATYEECLEWRANAMEELLRSPPDLVVIANSSRYHGWLQGSDGHILAGGAASEAWIEALERTARLLTSAGSRVVLIRDNPEVFETYRDCLTTSDYCARPRMDAIAGLSDDYRVAHEIGDGVQVLDFTDRLCSPDDCGAMIDDEIVYQDRHHLTANFTTKLAGEFSSLLQ